MSKFSELQKYHESQEPTPSKLFILKEILIGFIVTIICNLAGMYFYISAVSDMEVMDFLKFSLARGFISSVIGLGALMDFLPFFVFLKKGQYYRVRGVLLGVLTAAGFVAYFILNK